MSPLFRKRKEPLNETVSLYYAGDLHGSERLWRKFLTAGRYYKVKALVMGGDLTGKAIIPIVRSSGEPYRARFLGEERTANGEQELDQLMSAIRLNGMYPWVATASEVHEHTADKAAQDQLFDEIIDREMRRWVAIADERLEDSEVEAFVIAGNDDPWSVDDALRASRRMVFCDDQVVRVGEHEMISCSYANRTPWDSHRELDEDDLYARLSKLAGQLERPETAIFNLHVPPFDSGLDVAIQLNDDLSPVTRGGEPIPIPVGSSAVRQIIEEVQPVLALHGHIHESKGETHIGRTLVINPGSEYNSGRIHGALVRIAGATVMQHQLVVG